MICSDWNQLHWGTCNWKNVPCMWIDGHDSGCARRARKNFDAPSVGARTKPRTTRTNIVRFRVRFETNIVRHDLSALSGVNSLP
jgi:hypothetical protein